MSGYRSSRAARAAMLCCAALVATFAGTSQAQATCAPASTAKYPTAVKATSGLLGYWRLNETSGTQACDAHSSMHGTYAGSMLYGQAGALSDLDPAAAFDGASTGVRIPNSFALNPLAVSIEAWVHTNDITLAEQTIARKGSQWLFRVTGASGYTNGNLHFRVYTPTGYINVQDGAFRGGNTWKHVVATFDGATLRLYSDGEEVAAALYSGSLLSSTSDLMIGRKDSLSGDHFAGRLDEVSIYSRALTAAEVRAHWEKSSPETTLSSVPDAYTNSGSASFSFSSADAATTSYECKLDTIDWAACTSPAAFANLGDGRHTFSVRAKTGAGFVDVTPPKHSWKVERLALQAAETLRADGAEVRWTQHHGAGFTSYEVHRGDSPTFTTSATTLLAKITDQETRTYRDTSATPSKTFTYKLLVNGAAQGTRTVTLPADGEVVKTLQPGPDDGKGAFGYDAWDCANHGAASKLSIGRFTNNGAVQRALLGFDLSDIPASATVYSADLALRNVYSPGSTVTAEIHRVTTAWEEGDEDGDCEGPGSSWKYASAGVPWTTPGGDFDPQVEASKTQTAGQALGTDSYDLKSLVSQWVGGKAPNHGMLFKLSDETPGTKKYVHYHSDDYSTDITHRPKLVVHYRDGSTPVKPTVELTTPAPGTNITGATTLSATGGDDRRVTKVEFLAGANVVYTDAAAPFTYSWTPSTAYDGAVSLTARAHDDAGHIVTSSPVATTVDMTGSPTISITDPAPSYRAAVLRDAPAAYWPLNEAAGATTAADVSGNSRTGTYSGLLTYATGTLVLGGDRSATFKHSSTVDGAMSSTGLGGLGGAVISAEAWVQSTSLATTTPQNDVVARGAGAAGGWNLSLINDGAQKAVFQIQQGTTVTTASTVITPGRMHLAGTYDGANLRLYVDGALKATTPLAAAALTTTAPTVVGQTLQNDVVVDEAAVYTAELTAAKVARHHVAGAGVQGSETIKVTATHPHATGTIVKVEFLLDGTVFDTKTASPWEATLDTVARNVSDGSHELLARATDGRGKSSVSTAVTMWVSNAVGTSYNATVTSTAAPVTLATDTPSAELPGYTVSVRNNSTTTIPATTTKLKWKWVASDGSESTTKGEFSLPAAIAPNTTGSFPGSTVRVPPPADMPADTDRQAYKLHFDVVDASSATPVSYASKGVKPVENVITIDRKKPIGLGLERFYQYDSTPLGGGMDHLVNLASGNSIVRWSPWAAPGRGLSKVLDLTYNSMESHSRSPVGNNFSLSISSLVRFGARLDIHPDAADKAANPAAANKYAEFIDGDGTTHRFEGVTINAGTTSEAVAYKQPPGVHLYLRKLPGTDTTRTYALTRPDRVTFYFDAEGYPTYVRDGNDNELRFHLESVPPADDPGGPKKRVRYVYDAANVPTARYTINYFVKGDTNDPQIRGRVKSVQDHNSSQLLFNYYGDGNLRRITEKGDAATPDRDIWFVYTLNASNTAATDVNSPGTHVPNQSTRLHSVRDPLGKRTTFTYLDPANAADRNKIVSRTDRSNRTTTYAYEAATAPAAIQTTVTPPSKDTTEATARRTVFKFDASGQVLEILEPLNTLTKVAWNAHNRHVSQVTEPAAAGKLVTTKFEYDDNGYLTEQTDQMGRVTTVAYDPNPLIRVDDNDASGKWVGIGSDGAARNQSHISQILTRTDPLNNVWTFDHDDRGNLESIDEPGGYENILNIYDTQGNLTSSEDQNDNVTTYGNFHVSGQPQTVTEVAVTGNRTTNFTYTADGLLDTVRAPRHGNPVGVTDLRPHQTQMTYDAFHRLIRQRTPKGDADSTYLYTEAKYDANDNVVRSWAPHKGALEGNSTPSGTQTDFTYDPMDRINTTTLVRRTDGQREEDETVVDLKWDKVTEVFYDPAGRVDFVKFPRAAETPADDELHRVFYEYDFLDRVKRTKRFKQPGQPLYEQRCYDDAGNLKSVTQPKFGSSIVGCAGTNNAYTSTFTYEDDHKLKTAKNPDGKTTTNTYNGNGALWKVTDAESNTTENTYDGRGHLIEVKEPFRADSTGTVTKYLFTKYVYDGVGNLRWEFSPRAVDHSMAPTVPVPGGTTLADADAANAAKYYVTGYEYNQFNELKTVLLPQDLETPRAYVHRTYDLDGNLSATSLPMAASTMPAAGTLQHQQEVSTYEYFDTGWLKSSRNPNSVTVNFDYTPEGWQQLRTPESGEKKFDMKWRYYVDGSVAAEVAADLQSTGYEYDRAGNLISGGDLTGASKVKASAADQKLADPVRFLADYDPLNRVETVRNQPINEDPDDDGKWTGTKYFYDDNGQVETRIDNAKVDETTWTEGRKYTNVYSQAGRLSSFLDLGKNSGHEATPNAADDRFTTYTYLGNGWPLTRKTVKGTASEFVQEMTWTHFKNGLTETQKTMAFDATKTVEPKTRVVESHTLSYLNEESPAKYQNGHPVKDTYTLDSARSGAPCRTAECVTRYTYDAQERVTDESRTRDGNTLHSKYVLNPAGSVTSRLIDGVEKEKSTYAGPKLTFTELIDPDNDPDTPNPVTEYGYDVMGQMQCAVQKDVLKTDDCDEYTPETGGRTGLLEFNSWDAQGRLKGHENHENGGYRVSRYNYDALDRLVSQEQEHPGKSADATRETRFTYNGISSELVAEEDRRSSSPGTVAREREYAYDGHGERVGMTDTKNPGATGATTHSFAYGQNARGDVSLLVKDSGEVQASYAYDAYGQSDRTKPYSAANDDQGISYEKDPTSGDETKVEDPLNAFRYSGHRFDTGAANMDMGARRFSSKLGSFMSEDFYEGGLADIGLSTDRLTTNRYSLAGGNPVSFVEADGHEPIEGSYRNASTSFYGKSTMSKSARRRQAASSRRAASSLRTSTPDGSDRNSRGYQRSVDQAYAKGNARATKQRVENNRSQFEKDMDTLGDVSGAAADEFSFGLVKWGDAKGSEKVVGNLIGMANPKGLVKEAGEQIIKQGGKALDDVAARGGKAGSTAARSCLRSFAGRTLVLMSDGSRRPIEDIAVGDSVLATDPETGERVSRKVTRVWVHDDVLFDLAVDGEVVTTTEDHRFWNATDQRFKEAVGLDLGDMVLASSGRRVRIRGLRRSSARTARAYNLAIEGVHTYHVGRLGLLVHNDCDIPVDGSVMTVDDALARGQAWLGKGYTEPVAGSGRYVSADGRRVFRMGESDITGAHGGGPHVNFETLVPNPARPGRLKVGQNSHVYLRDP